MVCRADSTSHANESPGDGVSNPHAEPGLPPGKAVLNLRRGNHPGILCDLSTLSNFAGIFLVVRY